MNKRPRPSSTTACRLLLLGLAAAAGPIMICSAFQVLPLSLLPSKNSPKNTISSSITTTPNGLLLALADSNDSSTTSFTTTAGFQQELATLEEFGIPLLACNADQVHSFCTALWSVLAQVSDADETQTTCLVLDQIPLSALRAFVEDYLLIKETPRLMTEIPELERIDMVLVGDDDPKTVGPAILIQSSARTAAELQGKEERHHPPFNKQKCIQATQSFVQRIVVGEEACPYTKDPNFAATGLEKKGITPGPVAYRFSDTSDVCGAMAAFWEATSEVMTTEESDLSTTLLSLPGIGPGRTPQAHDRFAVVTELMGRNLCLFRGDGTIGLVHFHPAYDRSRILPADQPAYGHLPPQSWLPAMLKLNGNTKEALEFTEDDYVRSNYQRRSPHTVINILRAAQLNAAVGGKSIVELDVHGDGSVMEPASGISTYSRNAIRLANMDLEVLDAGIQAEMAMMLD